MQEKWSDERVKLEIKSIMRQMGIDRMPTRKEIEGAVGNLSLCSQISLRGGSRAYAQKNGIKFVDMRYGNRDAENEKLKTELIYELLQEGEYSPSELAVITGLKKNNVTQNIMYIREKLPEGEEITLLDGKYILITNEEKNKDKYTKSLINDFVSKGITRITRTTLINWVCRNFPGTELSGEKMTRLAEKAGIKVIRRVWKGVQ